MSEKKRVYISGPMSGMENLNFPAFNGAESVLKSAGYTTLNPATHILQGWNIITTWISLWRL